LTNRLDYLIEAYDDGFFPANYKGGKGRTYLVGVEVEGRVKVRKIAWLTVRVDFNTTTRSIISISKILNGRVILLDGLTYAGFDVVDPVELSSAVGKAVIVIQTHPLNLAKMRLALEKHFEDWQERYRVIENVYKKMVYVDTPWRTIRIYNAGISVNEAINVVKNTCIYSPVPEPLRIADKVASAISRLTYLYA